MATKAPPFVADVWCGCFYSKDERMHSSHATFVDKESVPKIRMQKEASHPEWQCFPCNETMFFLRHLLPQPSAQTRVR